MPKREDAPVLLTQRRKVRIPGKAQANSVAFSADGSQVAVVWCDADRHLNRVVVYDLEKWKRIATFAGCSQSVSDVTYLPDGRLLVCVGETSRTFMGGEITVRTAFDRNVLLTVEEEGMMSLRSVALSPDGRTMATGSALSRKGKKLHLRSVKLDYANSLLRVAELSRAPHLGRSISAVSLLTTGDKPSNLRQRIARLLGESATPSMCLSPHVLVLALCVPVLALLVSMPSGASNALSGKPHEVEASKETTPPPESYIAASPQHGEKVTHHIALGDGHTLIAMFDKDAKCDGIQRVRGEDEAPLERATPTRSNAGLGNDREVRFDDFPAPAEFEESRPHDFEPTTLSWEDILKRLKSEEQKYETLEVLIWVNQQASQDRGREYPQAEIRERMVRVKEDSYCVKTTVVNDHQFRREEVVRGRWWLRRLETPSRPDVAARSETFVLPANHHRLAPHCLAIGEHLEDVVQTLSWKLTDDTPGKRLLVEVLGEEVVQSERCVKLRVTDAARPGSASHQLYWLSLDHNLLPMRWESRTRNERHVSLQVRTVPSLLTIGEGVAFPKRVQSYFVIRTPEAREFTIQTLNTIGVAKATLKPQIPDGLFDKLGQPPKQDPPATRGFRGRGIDPL